MRVGDVTLRLHSRDSSPLARPAELRPFRATRGGVDIDVEVVTAALPLPATEPLFVSGGLWTAYRHGRRLLYVIREPVRGRAPLSALVIDEGRRKGKLFLAPGAPFALHYPLDELLFQHHLARHGGMEVHACGVAEGGAALLFCGVSGAGKTTTARLWRRHRRGAEILSDDRMIVRRRGGRLWAFGTPWHGSGRYASARGLPLGGLFFLARGQEPSVTAMAPVPAAAELFARSFPPPWEAKGSARVLALCARVAAEVPCARLRFRPDASAVRAVLAALAPPTPE
ncbi:MAG TPA: hypothetical protein VFK70_07705 [Vicinamibacteria bacterium]|nr:hypothetical protein [Vicinamibacteria bacterium]